MVLAGLMRRLPFAGTVPIPLLIATFVEPVTFHRRIADWPRSILDGSTENSATTGLPEEGVFVGTVAEGAGGGGGGIGVFLLQADAIRIITTVRVSAALLKRRNRNM
jgi:hypothetical protein